MLHSEFKGNLKHIARPGFNKIAYKIKTGMNIKRFDVRLSSSFCFYNFQFFMHCVSLGEPNFH